MNQKTDKIQIKILDEFQTFQQNMKATLTKAGFLISWKMNIMVIELSNNFSMRRSMV